jgi:carbonic anhydrase/acetyltransferase-like protein (isoleucine patch superfamily)
MRVKNSGRFRVCCALRPPVVVVPGKEGSRYEMDEVANYENLARVATRLAEPTIDDGAWVAPGAIIVGDVRIARGASVWYGCVLRSDIVDAPIVVGEDTNIQDGSVLHIDFGKPCVVGARVTVGHRAVIHGATVGDGCLVGMGSVVLSGAKIGEGSVVAAGAVVRENFEVPPGVVVAGVPAKVRVELDRRARERVDEAWRVYSRLAALHAGRT